MKPALASLLFSSLFTLSNAQDPAESTGPAAATDKNTRDPFTLTLLIDKERQYEQEIDSTPYVHKDIVYLFSGEVVGISLSEREDGHPAVSYCHDIEKADVLFRFSQKWDKKDETLMMLLAIDSRIEKELFMDGLLVVPGKEKVFETTILPLKPKTTNYESWPHPVIQLAIRNLRFEEKKTDMGTDSVPKDRVVTLKDARIEELIRTYSAMSREELPGIIKRFKKGLEEGSKMFVTTRITDPAKNTFEQVFVEVSAIEGDVLSGRIASHLTQLTNYRIGDPYSCQQNQVLDWTIQKPDRSEEGNYVGRFMDVVKDDAVPLIIEAEIDTSGKVTSATFNRALNRYKQDVSFCIPDETKRKAEKIISESVYPDTEEPGKHFIHLIYRFHDDVIEKESSER
ncbi:MAG: DUF2314 domain-containing protein [Verrucomicrobiales bacterium]|nr:DUF2314 domain-containing protein [Verrucomicrobiales bacterium]